MYETTGDGSVEIDLRVFWAGDPDVVLGVRGAQDSLSVPVSLTEFECSFTLRLIFAPLLGVFPCFGALTIALMEEPALDFDLRVVGGDVTLVPGLKAPLKQYILALIASWMVWPRCITVAIPGTGYTLPVDEDAEKPTAGLLHITVVGHDGAAVNPGEVGLQVRWPVADLLVDKNQSEARVKASPGGGMLSSKEITLPVEDPKAQLLCVRWYTRAVVDEDTGKIVRPEVLDGEASVVLDDLRAQAVRAAAGRRRRRGSRGVRRGGDPFPSPRSSSRRWARTSSPSAARGTTANRAGWSVACGAGSRASAAAWGASFRNPRAAWFRGTRRCGGRVSVGCPRCPARS